MQRDFLFCADTRVKTVNRLEGARCGGQMECASARLGELRGHRPLAGQGRQPLPREVMPRVTSYWVLPDAGIGRTGSKAAFLPSSALGENEGKCPVPCGQRGQAFPVGGTLERKGEDCD